MGVVDRKFFLVEKLERPGYSKSCPLFSTIDLWSISPNCFRALSGISEILWLAIKDGLWDYFRNRENCGFPG
jgi:hypothetical protein